MNKIEATTLILKLPIEESQPQILDVYITSELWKNSVLQQCVWLRAVRGVLHDHQLIFRLQSIVVNINTNYGNIPRSCMHNYFLLCAGSNQF